MDRVRTLFGRPGAPGSLAVLLPILVLAFNLRPVAVSVGPVLNDLMGDLHMNGTVAGLLTSLPTLCFSAFGAITPQLSRRIGMHYTVGISILLLIAGQVGRAWVNSAAAFLALSVVALAGMAMSNILIPSLVRYHFPRRVGLATALYSLTMTLGVTAASIGTVPLAGAVGGWRAAFTAGVVIAVAAGICWIPVLRLNAGRHGPGTPGAISIGDVARTRMGWLMAVFFGCQSAQAYTIFGWLPSMYIDAGLSQFDAGVMLGLATGVGIVPSFLVPRLAARIAEPVGLFLTIMAFLVAGFGGLWLAPATLPWVWAVFIALGTASFPLLLALLGLRTRTPSGTTALSGFTQSVGYLLAALGPLVVGLLRQVTSGWTPSLLFMLAITVPMTIAGVICCRTWYIEDEVARRRGGAQSSGG